MIWLIVLAIDFVVGLGIGLIKQRRLGCMALALALLWPLLLVVRLDAVDGTAFALWELPWMFPGRLVALCAGLLVTRSVYARG